MSTSSSPDLMAEARQALAAFQRELPRGIQVRATLSPAGIHLERIHTASFARGKGSEVMRGLLAVADAAELPVTLHAQASGQPQDPSTEDLLRWYRRFGFEVVTEEDEGPFMQRPVGSAELAPSAPARRRPSMGR